MSVFACESTGDMEADQARLNLLLNEINQISASRDCENSADWRYTAVGSKACGGPTGYVAYHQEIDTVNFLEMVQNYTSLQAKFNETYGVASDCSYLTAPAGIECENGKPVFLYEY